MNSSSGEEDSMGLGKREMWWDAGTTKNPHTHLTGCRVWRNPPTRRRQWRREAIGKDVEEKKYRGKTERLGKTNQERSLHPPRRASCAGRLVRSLGGQSRLGTSRSERVVKNRPASVGMTVFQRWWAGVTSCKGHVGRWKRAGRKQGRLGPMGWEIGCEITEWRSTKRPFLLAWRGRDALLRCRDSA